MLRDYVISTDGTADLPISEHTTSDLEEILASDEPWLGDPDLFEEDAEIEERIRIELLIRARGWK